MLLSLLLTRVCWNVFPAMDACVADLCVCVRVCGDRPQMRCRPGPPPPALTKKSSTQLLRRTINAPPHRCQVYAQRGPPGMG